MQLIAYYARATRVDGKFDHQSGPLFWCYVVGKITGRAFKLGPKRAQRIGEYIVMAVIIGVGVAVTLVYS